MKKNIISYIGKKYAVQCSSKEEWQKIMDLAPDKITNQKNYFDYSLAKIINLNDFGTYWGSWTKEQIEASGYTILSASDFLIADMRAIQEEAKRRFPIGCKFKNIGGRIINKLEKDECVYTISENNNIWASRGHGLLYEYETDKWAELISLSEEIKEQEDLILGKFKIGDIVVSLTNIKDYRKSGDIFKVLEKSRKTCLYYLRDRSSSVFEDWRLATPEEVKAYSDGVKNIFEISSKPNFVVGKWYKYNNWYIKYSHENGGTFISSEKISPSKVHEYCKSPFGECDSKKIELTDLTEIQQYLPEGHPELEKYLP